MKITEVILSKHSKAKLTMYIQQTSRELANQMVKPAVLIFPGGGYQMCSEREGEPVALAFLNKGFNAFVLEYSLLEESVFPKPLEDANQAMTYLVDHADELHIDPNQIVTIGFSAGGHLAAMLGTCGDIRPKAQILIYPALIRSVEHGWDYPTPIVDEHTPETFIVHTYFDGFVPLVSPLYFLQELHKKNIPVEFHLFRNGLHGLSLGTKEVSTDYHEEDKEYQKWFDMAISWLKHVL